MVDVGLSLYAPNVSFHKYVFIAFFNLILCSSNSFAAFISAILCAYLIPSHNTWYNKAFAATFLPPWPSLCQSAVLSTLNKYVVASIFDIECNNANLYCL